MPSTPTQEQVLFRAAVAFNGHANAVTRVIELAFEKDVPVSARDRQKVLAWLDQAKSELANLTDKFVAYSERMALIPVKPEIREN